MRNKLAEFYDGELANVTGKLFDALKEIERLNKALDDIADPNLALLAETKAKIARDARQYQQVKP